MRSLRSYLILFLLKHRHWFRGQRKRETIDRNTSIPAQREKVERSAGMFGKLPEGMAVTPVQIGAMHAEWLRPAAAPGDRVMLYFHGGGYVMGSARSHRAIVAKFVLQSGLPALIFDYRLAPEHPFPAALDDAVAAYRWLLDEGYAPSQIAFAGDSAGGGLALATLLAVRDGGLPLPAAAAVMSPWTDLKSTGGSYSRRDPLAPDGSWAVYSAYYAGDEDPGNPLISPLYGDLAGLPPLLIYVGDDEAMLDDAVGFADKARAAGVDVRLHVGRGMVHCYPAMAPMFPEATAALNDICAFLAARTTATETAAVPTA